MKTLTILAATLSIAMSGCNFIKSTMILRQDDNTFVGNSNGDSKHHCETRPFRGVPVALKVPTHVDVKITETYFLRQTVNEADGQIVLQEVVFNDTSTPRNLSVTVTPITTKKLFTVDFVRPVAGTLNYNAEFTDDQYFSKIENTIVDETIKDITEAIKTVAPTLGFKASATLGTNVTNIATAERTLGYARFDIDSPAFEDELNGFVSLHVTGCHACDGRVPLHSVGDAQTDQIAPPVQVHGLQPPRLPLNYRRQTKLQSRDPQKPVLSTSEYAVYPAE